MTKTLTQTNRYLDMNKILGHQKSIYMLLTDRGFGKTYSTKRLLINDYLKRGKKFVYLRRYKSEMKTISTFFDDVAHLYPDHEFKVRGWNFYIDGKVVGVGFVLTRYQDYKGGAFPDFDNILFDEFLREKVKSVGYLNNDVEAFLSVCDSVFRDRENVKAIMLSNTVNEVNPYFIDLKINRMNNSEYAYSQLEGVSDKLLCFIREVDEESKEVSIKRSNFREILHSVDKYAQVAISNKFSEEGASFVGKKSREAKFELALRLNEFETFGVWFDYENIHIYLTQSYEKTTKSMYVFDKESHNDNTILIDSWKENYKMKHIVNAFKRGQLTFENTNVKMKMFDLFSKLRIF